MSAKKRIGYFFTVCALIALIVYGFFCPNDAITSDRLFEIIAVSTVTIVLLLLVDPKNKIVRGIISWVIIILSPFYIMHYILYDRTIRNSTNYWTEVLIIVMLMCLVIVFFRKTAAAVASTAAFGAFFVISNEMALCFRNAALSPTDIFSMGTAISVSGEYHFIWTYKAVIAVLCAIALALVAIKFNVDLVYKHEKHPFHIRLTVNLLLTIFPLMVLVSGVKYIKAAEFKDMDQFDLSVSNRNAGMATTFVNGIKNMLVKAPEGYSNKNAEAYLSTYSSEDTGEFKKPNVIVIMNESFSDLSPFCGIGDDSEYMPNLLALKENTRKGYVQVSVFGGNTANSEFEFLTGNSLHFLPIGYIAYMRTITKRTPSIVNDFAVQGYSTLAIHPYMPQCWRRNDVYPLLGFEEFISGKDFDENHETTASKMRGSVDFGDLKYIRKYISDEENYDMVLKKLKEKPDGKPMFIFNVTMQNHGPYTYQGSDFDEYLKDNGITLQEDIKDRDEVMQYLTLVKESDRAFQQFIERLQDFEEPTVVVMFGDHLPGLAAVNDSIRELPAADKQAKYTVPYYMWANYPIESMESTERIGLPYLSNDLKKLINMPLTRWDVMREEVREDYPSLNAYGAFDSSGEWIERKSGEEEENGGEPIDEYRIIQYGHLFRDIK